MHDSAWGIVVLVHGLTAASSQPTILFLQRMKGCSFLWQVINVAVKGASILPIGVNINPAVIIVNPQGAAIWVSPLAMR